MSFVLFFLFWFSIVALAYGYAAFRLIRNARLEGGAKVLAWFVAAIWYAVPQVSFLLVANKVERSWVDGIAWVGFVVLGLFSVTFTLLLGRDFLLLLRKAFSRVTGFVRKVRSSASASAQPVDRERRRLLIHSTNLGIIALSAGITGYGFVEARRRPVVKEVDVPLSNLPKEFNGFRIAQFTDLHVGPTIKRGFVERVVDQINGLGAEAIVFTGDLVDGSVPWLKDDVAPLRELVAPFGKFFVTGNHEYYSGASPWIKEAARLGFHVLMNEHHNLERNGARIVMAGVTDYVAGQFIPSQRSDPFAAAAGAAEGIPRILLAHQPRSIFAASEVGFDLQLSGHTHGGQFFPWNVLATLNQPYISGLHKHGSMWIYVSYGTGYWGPPLRLGIPSEITLLKLIAASPPHSSPCPPVFAPDLFASRT